MKPLTIAPNKPLTVALADPEGAFDLDRGIGTYQTTTGATLTLPRPAVVMLNLLEPGPGEEIVIQKHWTGKAADKAQWTIALSPKSEKARAAAEEPDTLMQLEHAQSVGTIKDPKPVRVPTPIGRPTKRKPPIESQPRLFDRGTGTDGPAPQPDRAPLILPAAAVLGNRKPGQIPANIAIKEILAFLKADPSTANWDAQSVQDLASTVYIAAVKQGQVGLWERSE